MTSSPPPAPTDPPRPPKLWSYLSLARISNAPTVLTNVLAGAALAQPQQLDWKVLWLAVAVFLFYTAGMFLNDICDLAIDRQERPERPIPAGLVNVNEALFLTVLFFGLGLGLLVPLGLVPLAVGGVLVALIVLYDVWHKNNPLSPLLMGLCRATVYVLAFVTYFPASLPRLWIGAGWMLLYILSLTWIAKSEVHTSTGTDTTLSRTRWTGYLPGALPFLPAFFYLATHFHLWTLLAALPYLLWVGYSLTHVYRSQSPNIGRTIGHLIAGIALFDGLIMAAMGAHLWTPAAWVLFALTVLFQRKIKGT